MADEIRRAEYYSASIANKPGEAARILGALAQAGVNLVAFSGFPEGARKAQVDFVPEDPAAFRKAARAAGLALSPRKTAFLIDGEDHPGASGGVASKLAEAGINIIAMQTVCAGGGRFGGIFWVAPADVRKAARTLGAK